MTQASSDPIETEMREIRKQIGKSENLDHYRSKLDAMGPHASPERVERFELAVAYLEHDYKQQQKPKKLTPTEVQNKTLGQLKGIDFSKEVELTKLPQGHRLSKRDQPFSLSNPDQFGPHPEPKRMSGVRCFSEPGHPVHRLGIHEGTPKREYALFRTEKPIVALRSSTNAIRDNFTQGRPPSKVPGTPVEGGGLQYHINSKGTPKVKRTYTPLKHATNPKPKIKRSRSRSR